MSSFIQDLRYALRTLAKSPGFFAAAAAALALGIGANTAIFSFVNAFLLRPLPFERPEELVHVWATEERKGYDHYRVSLPEFHDWKQRANSFSDLAAFNYSLAILTGLDRPERLSSGVVSANVFELLGAEPLKGRAFRPGEDRAGADKAALVSERFWRNRLGEDRQVLGRELRLDGEAYTIVGVMPDGFRFPLPTTDVWIPRVMDADLGRARSLLQVVGRLEPGVSLHKAQEEMNRISAALREEYPQAQADRGANVVPLRNALNFAHDIIQPMSGILLAAVGFVLLIACANVANLLLSRSVARRREIALRAALGAGRTRLTRQLLTESLVLALAGALGGVALAYAGTRSMASMIPDDLYKVGAIGLDGSALAYTLGLAVLTSLIFGIAPALQASRCNLTDALKDGGAGAGYGRSGSRLHSVLVTAEISLAIILLVGAALMMRSMLNLQGIDPGFRAEEVLAVDVKIPASRYGEPEKRREFHRRVRSEVASLPGVLSAATVDHLPLNHEYASVEFWRRGLERSGQSPWTAIVLTVSPGYFDVMGIPLPQGRELRPGDDENAPLAGVISQAMAERYWPDSDPVGDEIEADGFQQPVRIVGVAQDTLHVDLDEAPRPMLYLSQLQAPGRYLRVLARTRGDPLRLAPAVRQRIWNVDPALALPTARTVRQVVEGFLLPQRSLAESLGVLSAGALLLAAVGIYGLMAYFVSRRLREIGIRVALGAARKDVLAMVMGRVARLTSAGVLIGLAGAFALTRFMAGFLSGVEAADPLSFLAIAAILAAVSLAAAAYPALRASRVDPMTALRSE